MASISTGSRTAAYAPVRRGIYGDSADNVLEDNIMPKINCTKIPASKRVTVLVNANPKKKGSRPAARFALLKKCGTVAEVLEKYQAKGYTARLAYGDLRWDAKREFIALG